MAYYLRQSSASEYVTFPELLIASGADYFVEMDLENTLFGMTNRIVGNQSDTNSTINIFVSNDVDVRDSSGSRARLSASSSFALNQRYVIRIERVSGVTEVFVDGSSIGTSTAASGAFNFSQFFRNGSFNSQGTVNLYYVNFDGRAFYDPSASNGTGLTLPDTTGTNDGTLVNFPTDDSQWVFYDDGTGGTELDLGSALLTQPNTLEGTVSLGVPLDGLVSTDSTLSGGLGVAVSVTGTLVQPTSLNGAIVAGVPIAGDIIQSATLSATVSTEISLQATLTQPSVLEADLTLGIPLTGIAEQPSTLAGTMFVGTSFEGVLTQPTKLEGSLTVGVSLTGEIAQNTVLEASLNLGVPLSGTLIQVSTLETPRLRLGVALQGRIAQPSTFTGTFILAVSFGGSLTQPSYLSGFLNQTLLFVPSPLTQPTFLGASLRNPPLNSTGWLTVSDIFLHNTHYEQVAMQPTLRWNSISIQPD